MEQKIIGEIPWEQMMQPLIKYRSILIFRVMCLRNLYEGFIL